MLEPAEPATYRRYAEDCRRLAKTVSEEHRRMLLEIAEAWIRLAEDAESGRPTGKRS
jgi:hypothetical protein